MPAFAPCLATQVAAVEACTADDLRAHAKQLFNGAFTECLVHGNFTPEVRVLGRVRSFRCC